MVLHLANKYGAKNESTGRRKTWSYIPIEGKGARFCPKEVGLKEHREHEKRVGMGYRNEGM